MPYDYSYFNALDALICVTLLFSIAIGFIRGMIREILGLAAWISAAWIAKSPPESVTSLIQPWIQDPVIQKVASMAGVFVIALVLLMLAAQWIASLMHHSMFQSVDRSLGALFGCARGLLLMSGVYVVGLSVFPWDRVPPIVTQSKSVRWLNKGLTLWERVVPEHLQNTNLQNNIRILSHPIQHINPLDQSILPKETSVS